MTPWTFLGQIYKISAAYKGALKQHHLPSLLCDNGGGCAELGGSQVSSECMTVTHVSGGMKNQPFLRRQAFIEVQALWHQECPWQGPWHRTQWEGCPKGQQRSGGHTGHPSPGTAAPHETLSTSSLVPQPMARPVSCHLNFEPVF